MKSLFSSVVHRPTSIVHSVLLIIVGALVMSCTDAGRRTPDVERPTTDGSTVYNDYCLRCHGADGSGSSDVPDIRGRGIWKAPKDSVLFVLIFGMATQYSEDSVMRTMPPLPYTDAEIAAVGRYVNTLIGKREVTYTAADVQRVRAAHKAKLAGQHAATNKD
ncbi:MAG: cytochrome c [Ignavibacteriae bacterium]|nr:MAG: cytochrome c [Ignavibacteriota bacterium]